jgi:ribose transport system substrate-binding protein
MLALRMTSFAFPLWYGDTSQSNGMSNWPKRTIPVFLSAQILGSARPLSCVKSLPMWVGRLLAAASLCLFASGCHQGRSHDAITVIPRITSEALWVAEHGGVAEAAGERWRVYWNGPSDEGDVEQQIALAERAINQGTLGLVLSPNSPFALNTVIQRALSRKIPVVIVGAAIPMPAGKGLSFIVNDVQKTGQLAAERMSDLLGGKGEVLVLGVDPMSPGNEERAQAFEQSLRGIAPQIHIAQRLLGFQSFGQAELATERAVRAHQNISGIFAVSITATRGAIAALRTTHSTDRIRIVGCDQALDLLFGLREGLLDSLVVQDMRTMGSKAVEQVIAERRGEAVPATIYIEPTLVTRDNIDRDRVQQLLRMDWRKRK